MLRGQHELNDSKYHLPHALGRVENKKSLIFFKSQAGLRGAHKNKVIHHISKFQNICFHIGNAPRRGLFENFKISL